MKIFISLLVGTFLSFSCFASPDTDASTKTDEDPYLILVEQRKDKIKNTPKKDLDELVRDQQEEQEKIEYQINRILKPRLNKDSSIDLYGLRKMHGKDGDFLINRSLEGMYV